MLRLRDISKTFIVDEEDIRFFEALKSVNITLTKNELVVILGKSGSGKSTLLNIIAGIDSFDNGTYYYFENRINKFEETHFDYFRSKKLGMVFQNYHLIDHLSVLENIIIAQRFGNNNKTSVLQARQALKDVGLSGYEAKFPYQLSSGERQRVAIARSIVNHPNMIIADEPTGNLDSVTSKEILELFKRLSKDRLVVMVTHDEDAAVVYADRVIQIDDGRVILDYKVTDSSSVLEDQEVIFKKRINPIASIRYGIKQLYIYKFKILVSVLLLSLSLGFLAGTLFYQKGYQNTVEEMIDQLNGIRSTLVATDSTILQNQDFDDLSNTIKSTLGQSVVVLPYHNFDMLVLKFNESNTQTRIVLENIFPYIPNAIIDDFKVYADGRMPVNEQEMVLSYEDALKLVRVDLIEDAWALLKDVEIEIPYETHQTYIYQQFVTELGQASSACFTYQWDKINTPTNFEQYGVGTFGQYQSILQNKYGLLGLLHQGDEYFVCSEAFLNANSKPVLTTQLKSNQIKETATIKIVGIIENRYQRFSYMNHETISDMVDKNHSISDEYVQIYYPKNTTLVENGIRYQPINYISSRLIQMGDNKENNTQTVVMMILFILFGLTVTIGFSNQVSMQAIKERKSISIIRSVGASKQDVKMIYLVQGTVIGLVIMVCVHVISLATLLLGNLWINVISNKTLSDQFSTRPINLFQFDYLVVIILSLVGMITSVLVYLLVYNPYSKEKIINLIRNK